MRIRKKRIKKRGYVRPSRAKPKMGWTLAQLAQLSGVTRRTIRVYLDRGLLPRPRFKGPATRYERNQLVWLLAIRRLRTTERLDLQDIATRLRALSAPELEAYAVAALAADATSSATATALGITPVLTTTRQSIVSATGAANVELTPMLGPKWARLELALGLELHVRADASARVLDLARKVMEFCLA